jgi:hypothetical protein
MPDHPVPCGIALYTCHVAPMASFRMYEALASGSWQDVGLSEQLKHVDWS